MSRRVSRRKRACGRHRTVHGRLPSVPAGARRAGARPVAGSCSERLAGTSSRCPRTAFAGGPAHHADRTLTSTLRDRARDASPEPRRAPGPATRARRAHDQRDGRTRCPQAPHATADAHVRPDHPHGQTRRRRMTTRAPCRGRPLLLSERGSRLPRDPVTYGRPHEWQTECRHDSVTPSGSPEGAFGCGRWIVPHSAELPDGPDVGLYTESLDRVRQSRIFHSNVCLAQPFESNYRCASQGEHSRRGRRDHHHRQCHHHCPGSTRPGTRHERRHDIPRRPTTRTLPAGPASRDPGGQLRAHRPAAQGHRGDQGLRTAPGLPAVHA